MDFTAAASSPAAASAKSLTFTNGTLKHHHRSPPHTAAPVTYKECLKNHAAAIGGHSLDGCGEFMPSSAAEPADPRSLKCAACGCHRNFHRRDPHDLPSSPTFLSCFFPPLPPPPPPLPPRGLSPSPSSSPGPGPGPGPSSPSPFSSPSPPVMSRFPPTSYVSQHHHLVAVGSAYSGRSDEGDRDRRRRFGNSPARKAEKEGPGGRKRHRTKFSKEQKEKMFEFSERLGWRMQKGDDRNVQDFCNEVGVSRGVFKVWMHNNKNTFRKKSQVIGNNTQIEIMNNEGDHHANKDDNHRNEEEEEGSRINLQISVN